MRILLAGMMALLLLRAPETMAAGVGRDGS